MFSSPVPGMPSADRSVSSAWSGEPAWSADHRVNRHEFIIAHGNARKAATLFLLLILPWSVPENVGMMC